MKTAAVAKYLHSLGLVVFDADGADCFLEGLPVDPVDAVAIKSLTGPAAGLEPWGWVAVQLLARSTNTVGRARSGYDRLTGLKDALHGLRHTTLDPGGADELRVIVAKAQTEEPVALDVDATDTPRWSLSVDLQVKLTDGRRFTG